MREIVCDARLFAGSHFILEDGLLEFREIIQTLLAPHGTHHFLITALIQYGRKDF